MSPPDSADNPTGGDAALEARQRRAALEAGIRADCDGRDMRRAVAAAIDLYGGELLGFLVTTCPDREGAEETYAELCKAICTALPRFEWRSSLRTWMYALARVERARHFDRRRRAGANASLSQVAEEALVAAPATSTALHQRTTMRQRLGLARQRLDADERELLVLRVDRDLTWSEIAIILDDRLTGASSSEVQRAAATLRKRFERTLAKLRAVFRELSGAG